MTGYDELDRAKTYRNVFGQSLTYTYDQDSHVTLRQDSLGGTLTSTYDALGRLESRRFKAGSSEARFDFAYNGRGELTTLSRFSDVAGTTGVGTTAYAYSDRGEVTGITGRNASGTTLADYGYAYDDAGRATTHAYASLLGTVTYSGTDTYAYDTTSQLTGDTGTPYSYDAAGNRAMAGYQTGAANRMTSDGVYTYTHDAEGNVASKSKGAGLETWFYAWDNRNRLVNVRATSDGTTTTLSVTYTYDAQDSRVQEDRWKSGVGTATARFGVERGQVWTEMDGSNVAQDFYVHGDQVDQLLARVDVAGPGSGTVAFIHADRLNSVRAVQVMSILEEAARYTAFGKIAERRDGSGAALVDAAASLAGRYAWTGRERDADTQMQYNRGRYYDLLNGRWYSEDPIGFTANDGNLYRYVANMPTGAVDPEGTDIVLLLKSNALANPWIGHAAVLIGQGDKWAFFTFGDGTDARPLCTVHVDYKGVRTSYLVSRHAMFTLGVKEEKSLARMAAFIKKSGYTDFAYYVTTPNQDRWAKQRISAWKQEFYHLTRNNCVIAASTALVAGFVPGARVAGKGFGYQLETPNYYFSTMAVYADAAGKIDEFGAAAAGLGDATKGRAAIFNDRLRRESQWPERYTDREAYRYQQIARRGLYSVAKQRFIPVPKGKAQEYMNISGFLSKELYDSPLATPSLLPFSIYRKEE